jgi:hypothetical protein
MLVITVLNKITSDFLTTDWDKKGEFTFHFPLFFLLEILTPYVECFQEWIISENTMNEEVL